MSTSSSLLGDEAAEWLEMMPRDKFYGDNAALWALCHHLGRPMVVWRVEETEQPPTVLQPRVESNPASRCTSCTRWHRSTTLPWCLALWRTCYRLKVSNWWSRRGRSS